MSCTICTEQFHQTQQPKVLTCGHTFCLECISDWFRTQQEQSFVPSGTVQCPICRRSTPLPASGDGVASLPTNFALLDLVEESEASVDDGSDVSKTTCSIHTGKALEYSCETCSGELVCGQCVKSKHQPTTGHRIVNLSTAMEREQKEKAELQRKVLELQQRNSELSCSSSTAISKPNPSDNNSQTKLKSPLEEILVARRLLKTNLSPGDSGLVSNPDQETAALDKAGGAVLDEIQNAQARLNKTRSLPSPSDLSLSGKPTILPKPVRRPRPHSVVLSPSSQQKSAVNSTEDLYGPAPSDFSLSGRPNALLKPVRRSRPHSVVLSPSSQQKSAVTSAIDPWGRPIGLYGPVRKSCPQFAVSPSSQQSRQPGGIVCGSLFSDKPPARNPEEEIDTEMLAARNKLAMVLQSSLPRSPKP
ncbi:tripartite motif-containing protein 3-like [Asterias rubens]|uniref:tripartite motif-containing protein 3-like n=1 Tax=Asterias rubens TaxID=7604 RepID=UPI0014556960|nr:tripartite motif-containing protein 3-like [Asterias rubens]